MVFFLFKIEPADKLGVIASRRLEWQQTTRVSISPGQSALGDFLYPLISYPTDRLVAKHSILTL